MLLLPSLLLRSVPGTHVAPPGLWLGPQRRGCPQFRLKRDVQLLGAARGEEGGDTGPASWSGCCSLWGASGPHLPGKPGVSSGAAIYVAQPGCRAGGGQAAPS